MGRTLVPRDKRLPLEVLAAYLLPLEDPPSPFDFAAIFGNPHPVELEVGFGKGDSCCNRRSRTRSETMSALR
jgi:tRNA G46 methylase TrmB